jgi:hypothetical protein
MLTREGEVEGRAIVEETRGVYIDLGDEGLKGIGHLGRIGSSQTHLEVARGGELDFSGELEK